MKKFTIFLLSFILIIISTFFSVFAAYNDEIPVETEIAYLLSLDQKNAVIYDKNSDVRTEPGAVVKIVTAIIAIEKCESLDDTITASSELIRSLDGTGCTTAGILVGETLSVRDLLYCLLLYNANDAAVLLASYTSGSIDAFTSEMNSLAERLGCHDTHFTDPNGFSSPDQYTTARDLAVIFEYCMNNSSFADIISTDYYEIPANDKYKSTRYLRTTNGLMNYTYNDYYYKYATGGKSGITKDEKCNVVSMASKDGYTYLCVVLNAGFRDYDADGLEENMAFVASRELYEWTFANIKLRVVSDPSTVAGELKVFFSDDYDYVSLVPVTEVSALVPAGVDTSGVLTEIISSETPESVKAPVKKGEVLGKASIKYAGNEIATVNLAAAFDIDWNLGSVVSYYFKVIFHSTVFKISAFIGIVILIVILFFLTKNSIQRSKKSFEKNKGER